MIIINKVTKKELKLLGEHRRNSGTLLIRDRCHAVLLNQKGYSAIQITDILDRDRAIVEKWLTDFNEERVASVFPRYLNNSNSSKLTKEQREEIKETLKKPNSLPSAFWSVPKLKEYITAKYGVVYESDRSYHHLFEISSYSFKLPEGFNKRRDEDLVKTRMLEIKRKIKKLEDTHEIFFADECSLHFATEYRKAWLPKNQKTILQVNTSLERQNYFGAWNMTSHKEELIPLVWQNTETIIGALQELQKRYPNKLLCIIWDNAGWHRSKELRSHLGTGNQFENITLLWLPPYAPDKNPQEHIWKYGKGATKNQSPSTFKELKTLFQNSIANKIFDYKSVGI